MARCLIDVDLGSLLPGKSGLVILRFIIIWCWVQCALRKAEHIDVVMTCKPVPHCWAFVRGIHRWPPSNVELFLCCQPEKAGKQTAVLLLIPWRACDVAVMSMKIFKKRGVKTQWRNVVNQAEFWWVIPPNACCQYIITTQQWMPSDTTRNMGSAARSPF